MTGGKKRFDMETVLRAIAEMDRMWAESGLTDEDLDAIGVQPEVELNEAQLDDYTPTACYTMAGLAGDSADAVLEKTLEQMRRNHLRVFARVVPPEKEQGH